MDCGELKDSLLQWFGREIDCQTSDTDTLITTLPILKPNGDSIEIGLESIGSHRWKISDLGETRGTLFLSGVELSEAYVRGYEFDQITHAHRITDDGGELTIEVSEGELAGKVFDFAHAIQSMLALQFTVKPEQPKRDFTSIVAKFLAEQDASFEVIPTLVEGKSGKWKFNFALNHVREETLIKAVSVSTKTAALRRAEESVFEIHDVQALREVNAVVVADDEGHREALWSPPVRRIFEEYNIPLYRFEASQKDLTVLAKKYAIRER